MGVHCGEAEQTAAGLVGLEVHRAARVAAVAYGGQVLVSEAAAALVRDWLPPDAALRDLGSHMLKDLGRPEQIFQLRRGGPAGGLSAAALIGQSGAAEQSPGPAVGVRRPGAGAGGGPGAGESARLVTLTGAGGCGKTRLAPAGGRRTAGRVR